ncbi:MAG TPA: hypothetical protein VIL51_11190 [Thermoleophilia bacterium]
MDENQYQQTPYSPKDKPVWDYEREPVSFRWNGNLLVTVNWCQMDGQWEAVGISIDIHPDATPRPLQRKDLDGIKMGEVLDYAAGLVWDEWHPTDGTHVMWDAEAWWDAFSTGEAYTQDPNAQKKAEDALPKRRGRPPLSLVTLREVAQVYDDAYRNRHNPTEAVQKRWNLKKSTASSWIFKARKNRLLPPTSPGQVRGHGLRKPKGTP